MKKGGGKQKGSAFERLVCKGLSLGITKGENAETLWRSATSGGRATVQRKKKVGRHVDQAMAHVAGDICSTHPASAAFVATWFVECKHYRDLDLVSFFFRNSGTLHKFWSKARTQARRCGKRPMVVFRQNGLNACVLISNEDVHLLELDAQELDALLIRQSDGTIVYDFQFLCQHAQLDPNG